MSAPALHPPQTGHPLTKEVLSKMLARAGQLKSHGFTPETSPELAQIIGYISTVQNSMAGSSAKVPQVTPEYHSQLNGNAPLSAGLVGHRFTNGTAPSIPQPSISPVSFSDEQITALRAHMHAFKLISSGQPIPEYLQQAIRAPSQVTNTLAKQLSQQEVTARVEDSATKMQLGSETSSTKEEKGLELLSGPFSEDDVNSGIHPYNAYRHPFTHLKRPEAMDPTFWATRMQKLLVPSIMPAGLDAHQFLAERDRFIEARITQRIRELEKLPSTIGEDGADDAGDFLLDNKEGEAAPPRPSNDLGALIYPQVQVNNKLRAMIELKSLRVIDKQRALRALVAERLTYGAMIPINRSDFRRTRKPTLRDARMTEGLERKQRVDRERRAKHKHVEQLNIICTHGRAMLAATRSASDRILRLGRAVLQTHGHMEKEEQKRVERNTKERLKALKADDEETYMKLIDTAKDTRITHLLKQTDSYLGSLAQSIVAQQAEGGHDDTINFETEDGPANENTFGAKIADDDVVVDKTKVDYYAVAHRISEKITKQPSILVGGTLKDYQIKGLQWMVSLYNNKLNGILADEMGLGKTIQSISLLSFLIEAKRQRGPYLVIVPLSTMTNWIGEFAKWAPSIKIVAYKGNPAQRRILQNDLRPGVFQVLLTTYEYIIKDRPILSKMKWLHMIIDEGHRMKNTESKLTQTLTTYYHTRYRLLLTGTPLQNNLPELWALLNFVLPKIFNSVKSFDEWFNTPFANSGTGDKIELNEEEALLIIRRLHKVLRPFLLRRLKKDVESELPDKVEKVIKVRMSALQSQLYKQMKKHKMIADGKESKGKPSGVKGLSNEIMQLRKICQHPFLFDSVEDMLNPSGMIDDKLIRSSGKVELLSRILPKFFACGHRVLIFFQMTKVMDIMEDFLRMSGFQYLRLDGGTKTEERANYVQLFNAANSPIQVFILSTRAGGLGLNLQSADTVIIFDSDWNPHADLQAQDRAHRIGQTKAVRILRFITEKSVEEAMYARARFKLDIDDKVIQAGRFDNKSTQEEQEEFLRSILEADQDEENEEAGDMNDDELNEMLARSDEEVAVFREMDARRERDLAEAWRAAGNRGRPPLGLMQLEELPECYRNDEPFKVDLLEEEAEGRGQRSRKVISYSDGLNDDEWAMALEEGEDIDELQDRGRKERRAANKLMDDAEVRGVTSPAPHLKARKGKAKAGTDSDSIMSGKRKRIGEYSVTPSLNGDEDDEHNTKRRKKLESKTDLTPPTRDRMKRAFSEILKAVMLCADETGRRRCELFKELPDRKEYPEYYTLIPNPIALSHLRKRGASTYYKNVQQYWDDWMLLFNNARLFNQEGSWVYVDADEMEKVFRHAFEQHISGSGLPGSSGGLTIENTEQAHTPAISRRGSNHKRIISDDEYSSE